MTARYQVHPRPLPFLGATAGGLEAGDSCQRRSLGDWLAFGVFWLVFILPTLLVVLAALALPIVMLVASAFDVETDTEALIWLAQFGGTLAAATVAWLLVTMLLGLTDLQRVGLFGVVAAALLGVALVL